MTSSRQFDLRSVVTFISGVQLCRPKKMGGVKAVLNYMLTRKEITTRDEARNAIIIQHRDLGQACAQRPATGKVKGWYNELEARFGTHINIDGPQG